MIICLAEMYMDIAELACLSARHRFLWPVVSRHRVLKRPKAVSPTQPLPPLNAGQRSTKPVYRTWLPGPCLRVFDTWQSVAVNKTRPALGAPTAAASRMHTVASHDMMALMGRLACELTVKFDIGGRDERGEHVSRDWAPTGDIYGLSSRVVLMAKLHVLFGCFGFVAAEPVAWYPSEPRSGPVPIAPIPLLEPGSAVELTHNRQRLSDAHALPPPNPPVQHFALALHGPPSPWQDVTAVHCSVPDTSKQHLAGRSAFASKLMCI
ncbi:unnamed protein product [Periconia digitata]|uniref:Uncharacterized protein n=1 Tax=Periconia digitata TaxID=1303443 RepID=A0A9W4U720_9PLEO|nr:unnamed protein product [Periconia digitata]